MKTLDLRNAESEFFQRRIYPDQQPHIKVLGIELCDEVDLIAPVRSSLELVELMMCANALRNAGAILMELHIPYLMGARSDRIMEPGDSFDLQVIAKCIEGCDFQWVRLYDAHSDVAADLIGNCTNRNNRKLVETYSLPDAVLIIPDKGAAAKSGRYSWWNKSLKEEVQCIKSRDLSNGNITLTVQNPEACKNRNCIIIDDLCDGGGTFLAIADQIQPKHLTLMVTHGIFSKGFRKLEEKFQSIITTNSYYDWTPSVHSPILTVHPIL